MDLSHVDWVAGVVELAGGELLAHNEALGLGVQPESIWSTLSIYLTMHAFINISIFIPIVLSIYLFIYISFYLFLSLSIDLFLYLSFYLFMSLSLYPLYIPSSIYLSIYLSIYISIYLSFYLSIHISIYLSTQTFSSRPSNPSWRDNTRQA